VRVMKNNSLADYTISMGNVLTTGTLLRSYPGAMNCAPTRLRRVGQTAPTGAGTYIAVGDVRGKPAPTVGTSIC